MKLKFLIIILFLCNISIIAQNSYRKTIDSIAKANQVVGLAYTVVNAEKELDAGVYGVKIVGNTEPIQLNDKFHIGSNSKAFTAFLAAKMVETGKITWNTKFFALFPALQAIAKEKYYAITLQDLLSHRAYLPAFTSPEAFEKFVVDSSSVREQRIAFAKYVLQIEPVTFPQGQTYSYSNAGYVLAAMMLEKIADKAWEEQVINLFGIEMHLAIDFGFPNRLNRKQPWGHILEGKKMIATAPDYKLKLPAYLAPAGDICMPIQEYGKWLRHQLLGLQGRDSQLKQETYNFMHFGLPQYALGWRNMVKGDLHISTHEGSVGTFFCHAGIIQEKNIAIAIFANSAEPKTVAAITEISRILLKYFEK
jgi:CubicO group peptidase (beta-lactamase class C family)